MFYSLKNLSSRSVELLPEPWVGSVAVPEHITTKDAHKKWAVDVHTDYRFLSCFEGVSPEVRVDAKTNPAVRMHGLIVDYDYKNCSTDQLRTLVENPEAEFIPNYGSVSFSRGAKLCWLFEEPIALGPQKMLDAFAKKLYKELKLSKWLQGIDSGLLGNAAQYYEGGHPWVELGKRKIPHSMLAHWMWEAMQKVDLWPNYREYEIPMEALAEELANQYPSRWSGPFTEGARGVRFWDPMADNPTGAQVRKDGMMAYSGEQAFLSWEQIFGSQFVAQFAADKRKTLLENTYFVEDERTFLMRDTDTQKWLAWNPTDFAQQLRARKFSGKIPRGETESEVDKVESFIKAKRRIQGYGRILHHAEGIVKLRNGQELLNVGSRLPLEAMPHIGRPLMWSDGPTRFPLVHSFMSTLFTDKSGDDTHGQLLHLLAWIKHFYECGVTLTPETGLVAFLVGPPDRGKSFFIEAILGTLMGGYEDGSAYLVEDNRWTADLTAAPVIFVADGSATADHKVVTTMTNKLKKLVANATLRSAQKYRKEGELPWFGRIIVACNEDAESLSILPNMDISTKDKISLYKTSSRMFPFTRRNEMVKQLAGELPWFARFLLDWEYPESLLSARSRFTIDAFHHPELLRTALQQGAAGILSEILVRVMRSLLLADPDKRKTQRWIGSSAELYSLLSEANGTFEKEFRNVRALGNQMSNLQARRVLPIEVVRGGANCNQWAIPYDILREYVDQSEILEADMEKGAKNVDA